MIAEVFGVLTVAVCTSHGLVNQGGCPTAPPTHTPKKRELFDWVLGIPFSDRTQSNLFIGVNPLTDEIFGILSLSLFEIELQIESDHSQCIRSAVGQSISGSSKQFRRYLVSFVDKYNISTKATVIEEVRIWSEGEFLFIWSCVNLSGNTHDEAVLLIWSLRAASNRSYPNLVHLREAAGKYLAHQIINQMLLTLMANESVGGTKFQYCPAKESTSYFIIITWIFVCIVMLFICL